MDNSPRLTLTRYTRGHSPIAGHNTPFVGYRVRCSCGLDQRSNAPLCGTIRDIARPHLRNVHNQHGEAANAAMVRW